MAPSSWKGEGCGEGEGGSPQLGSKIKIAWERILSGHLQCQGREKRKTILVWRPPKQRRWGGERMAVPQFLWEAGRWVRRCGTSFSSFRNACVRAAFGSQVSSMHCTRQAEQRETWNRKKIASLQQGASALLSRARYTQHGSH